MKRKLFTTSLIIFLAVFYNCQKIENPKNICKECGSLDLSKMTFEEKISDLTAKTEVWKSVTVNDDNELKLEENVLSKDITKLYKYHFANGRNLMLGKQPFNYNGKFYFNALEILTDPNNKIYAINTTIFYEDKIADIDRFVEFLKNKYQSSHMTINKMNGDLAVYQWVSDNQIIQLVKDNKEGMMEHTKDGKTTEIKSTYLKLTVYNSSFIKNSVKEMVAADTDFVLFDQRHFSNN